MLRILFYELMFSANEKYFNCNENISELLAVIKTTHIDAQE